MVSRNIRAWIKDPEGGGSGWRTKYRDLLLAHDPACRSLQFAWLPREDGVSCPSDLFWCDGCKNCFFNEGCYGHDYELWLCDCCNKSLTDSEKIEKSREKYDD